MLIFDIDGTISPARVEEAPATEGETTSAGGFRNVFMPSHILEVLRSRSDVALLSTWDEGAANFAEAFGFDAEILLMKDFSNARGIDGKFEVIKALKPAGWADDHISPAMLNWCKANGVVTVKPRKGYILKPQLERFIAAADAAV